MKIAVLFKRRYMSHDVIVDRYARLYEFPAQLARLGHSVRAFCLGYRDESEGRIAEDVEGSGSLVWESFRSGPLLIGGVPGYLSRLYKLVREFRPDVLLGGSDSPHVIITVWLGRRLGIPVVLDLYDNYESFGLSRIPGMVPLYRRALRAARGVVAVSEPLAEYTAHYCPGVPVETLESTIDPSLFYPRDRIAARNELGLPEAEPLVGIAGSLTRSRGIELLYDAFLRLRAQGRPLSLVLAGNLDPRHPPPEDEGIRYLGRLRHEQMPVFHSALDVAVICMRDTDFGRYAFPQKAYEILACRTPLVTASVGALQRTLTGYPGCLYRPDDVDSLAEAIASQLARPQVPELEIPSWRDQARRLAAFLQRVADA